MCCKRLAKHTGRKNYTKNRHLRTIAGYIFATKACIDNQKNVLNSNISSTCPHNMVNFGRLSAEMDWRVWGTLTNFNGFRLASLLQRRRSTEVNQTLHGVWPSPGLVPYIYIFRGFLPRYGILPDAIFTSHRPSLALSYFGSVTARHLSSGRRRKPNFAALSTGCHLCPHMWPTF